MSRIAPLDPPYAADIQADFDRIMRGKPPLVLFRIDGGATRAPGRNFAAAACSTAGRCRYGSARSSSTAPAR